MANVRTLFKAEKDGTVLWSTMNPNPKDPNYDRYKNMHMAHKFANEKDKSTVEKTKGGNFLNDAKLFVFNDPPNTDQQKIPQWNWGKGLGDAADIWNCASWLFASNAEGLVHAFGGDAATKSAFKNTPDGVPTFWNIELPTIEANHPLKGDAKIGKYRALWCVLTLFF